MEKYITIICSIVLISVFSIAEELSDYTAEQVSEIFWQKRLTIPACVRGAAVAGIGTFMQEPSPQEPYVDIAVEEWWTPALSNNVIRIHELRERYPSNWIFPTNIPVVFFAITKRQAYANSPAYTNPETYPPEYCYSITNEVEASKFMFTDMDRAWFRVGRDNGLLHSFATNLWDCIRVNPNSTNYYRVLRDTDREVSLHDSWRVKLDASRELIWVYALEPEEGLAEKLDDTLLTPSQRNSLGNIMKRRFNWKYIYTNSVETWIPPE